MFISNQAIVKLSYSDEINMTAHSPSCHSGDNVNKLELNLIQKLLFCGELLWLLKMLWLGKEISRPHKMILFLCLEQSQMNDRDSRLSNYADSADSFPSQL